MPSSTRANASCCKRALLWKAVIACSSQHAQCRTTYAWIAPMHVLDSTFSETINAITCGEDQVSMHCVTAS